MEITRERVEEWLDSQDTPSMVAMALEFGVDPGDLGDVVKGGSAAGKALRWGLWGIVARSEERLYTAVYGPLAVIKRVEAVLGAGVVKEAAVRPLSEWVISPDSPNSELGETG
jgi:hypothetical protein